MAEFGADCWNKLHHTEYPRYEFILTYRRELCEGCGEYKRVVVEKTPTYYYDTRFVLIELLAMLFRIIMNGIIDSFYALEKKEEKKEESKKEFDDK